MKRNIKNIDVINVKKTVQPKRRPQIETQIPLIKEAMDNSDSHQMERLTHNIKGSATNTPKLLIF